jgi:hypothetical protein
LNQRIRDGLLVFIAAGVSVELIIHTIELVCQ